MSLNDRLKKGLSKEGMSRVNFATALKGLEGVLIAGAPILAAYCLWLYNKDGGLMPFYISLGIMAALFIARRLIAWPSIHILYKSIYDYTLVVRLDILKHLVALPLGAFKKLHGGKISQALSEDMNWLEHYYYMVRPQRLSDIITVVVLLISAFFISWSMALGAVITLALGIALLKYAQAGLSKGMRFRADGFAEASMHIMEFAQGMPVVRAFGDTQEAQKNYDKYVEILRVGFRKSIIRNAPLTALFKSLIVVAVSVAAIVGLLTLDWDHPDTFIIYTAALLVLTSLIVPMQAFLAYTLLTTLAKISDENLLEIENIAALPSGEIRTSPQNFDIGFEQVDFSYDDSKIVLKNISFTAKQSSITAIVGRSGSGKTTLMNMLMRFWDVQSGKIKLGGQDVRSYDTENLLDQVSTVFQETVLFKDSVINNIRIGRPDASDKDVVAAAKSAHIHDFIMSLPRAYQTEVGVGGSRFSGGEKQRIAIARAILKDAPIVILDEATSALDPENENAIQSAFSALAKNKTVFVIAHRLSTIIHADNILVLDEGELVDQGTHKELLKSSSTYQILWEHHQSSKGWTLSQKT